MNKRYILQSFFFVTLIAISNLSFSQTFFNANKNIKQLSPQLSEENSTQISIKKTPRVKFSKANKSKLKFTRRNSNYRASSDTLFFADFPSYTAIDSSALMGVIDGDSLYSYSSGNQESFEIYLDVDADSNYYMAATSWFTSSGQADNYFIVDSINIPSDGAILKWDHLMPDNDYRDGYDVYISIDSGNTLNILKSFSDGDPITDGDTTWQEYIAVIDSSIYGGKNAKIIFHHNAYDQYFLCLDNILLLDGSDTSQFISYASTCGSIFYQGFSVMNDNTYPGFNIFDYFDQDYLFGNLNYDYDSANFNYWISSDFPNAEFSNTSGAFLDSLDNDGDIRLMFSSWMEFTTDTANDLYGFAVNIPENGAILEYRHRFLDPLYRNGYSIGIYDTLTASTTNLILFDDNDSLTMGDSVWRDISITIDSNIWGNKTVYLYIHHQSVDQYIVEFDDIHLRGNCPVYACNSYTALPPVSKNRCGFYEDVPFPYFGNDTLYFETDTIYTDSAMINGNCYTQTLYLTIKSVPDSLTIIGSPNTVQYDVEYYSVTQSSGSYYDWSVSGGNILSGQGTNSVQVQWSTIGQGYVEVLESDSIGCYGDTTDLAVMVSPVVGLNEAKDARFMLYPNPAKGDISVIMNSACNGGQLVMYNILGEETFKITNLETNTLTIPHSDLSQGSYLIVLIKNDIIVRERLIIE